jgi:hypothetical protein
MYTLRIQHLEDAHRSLDKRVDTMEKTGIFNDFELEDLKKEMLLLKDKISILKQKQKEIELND